jgi:hypothetical protein
MVLCLDGQCKVGGELLSNGDVMMFRDHDLLNIQSVSSHSFLLTLENAMLNLV